MSYSVLSDFLLLVLPIFLEAKNKKDVFNPSCAGWAMMSQDKMEEDQKR